MYLLSSMASFLGYLLVIFFGAVPTPSRFDVSKLLTGEASEALSLQSCLELAGLEMSEEASAPDQVETWGIYCFGRLPPHPHIHGVTMKIPILLYGIWFNNLDLKILYCCWYIHLWVIYRLVFLNEWGVLTHFLLLFRCHVRNSTRHQCIHEHLLDPLLQEYGCRIC